MLSQMLSPCTQPHLGLPPPPPPTYAHLLTDSLTSVKDAHNGAHGLCSPDGGQAGHTAPDDQHLAGGHTASSCDLRGHTERGGGGS